MSSLAIPDESPAHALNNLLCKIMCTAELALDRVDDPAVQADLQAIMALAELAAPMIQSLREASS